MGRLVGKFVGLFCSARQIRVFKVLRLRQPYEIPCKSLIYRGFFMCAQHELSPRTSNVGQLPEAAPAHALELPPRPAELLQAIAH